MQPDTYPRQKARTRGFQLGRPRSFTIADSKVFFIRSLGPEDPIGSLWVVDLDDEAREVRLVDGATLLTATDLPAAERARRERMREVTSGITAFDVTPDGTAATFAVSGVPFHLDVVAATVRELRAPGPVIDPRISPDGRLVAFVSGNGLWVVGTDREPEQLCAPAHDHEVWGLADFIAAEELERFRGHWWVDGGLLVERVDDSAVPVRWIADPAQPHVEPTAHRYPQAGTTNATVELWQVRLDGSRTQVAWDNDELPYLASVHATSHGTTAMLLSRDQRTALTMRFDASTSSLVELARRNDASWVDVMPGVPVLDDHGRLLDIVADEATDTYRLVRDGVAITPAGLQVRALLDADADDCVVLASAAPECQAVYRVTAEGVSPMTDPAAFAGAAASGDVVVTAMSDAEHPGTEFQVQRGETRVPIATMAAIPLVDVRPTYAIVGERALRAVVMWPTGHVPGSARLPVIASPYGGPHAQRVVRSAMAYATEQWLADQGYAVVVIDGRGTPGRGPAWERAIRDDVASVVLQDQVDALQALGEKYADLDLGRVGIRGWSFGGYLAALAVLDRPDVFQAAVAGAPVTDWALYDTAYTERYLGHPQTNPAAYERTSLLTRAEQLARPLLLIHGLADDNVLAAHTLQLSSALLAAGKPHSVVPLSGVTHMTPQEVVAENLLRLEVDFFDTHLT